LAILHDIAAAAPERRHEEPAEGGLRDGEGPQRRCIVTREALPKEKLVRFVVDPGGTVVPDIGGDLPGRGLWLRADRDILALAARKNHFAKAARRAVTVPPGLPEQVERLLTRRCLDLLGLARRAGFAVAGFEPVQSWLAAGRVGVLLAASDGAADGRRKLQTTARQAGQDLAPVALFAGAELGAALGRDGAVAHVAVAPGRIADRLRAEAGRLAGLRGGGAAAIDLREDVARTSRRARDSGTLAQGRQ
jgi:predicted RNA-binding protein YlxR (DUF448 family)